MGQKKTSIEHEGNNITRYFKVSSEKHKTNENTVLKGVSCLSTVVIEQENHI